MKNVIGIDIGGTKITGIIWDGKKILDELTIVTPKNLFEFERNLIKLADFLSAKGKPQAVGIGMAGLVDSEKGVVEFSPNIKFVKNLNLVKLFQLNGFKNVKIDNDANCFTRSEMVLGQGKKLNNFLALTLGTGIGGGIVIGRKLYRGQNNSGGELGHALIGDNFFEEYYQKFRDKKDFEGSGSLLGGALASFINIFAPDAIIIGGSYGHNESKKYFPMAKREMKKHLFNKNAKTQILISQLKNSGALGAALLWK